jgi:hypothetical protein
LSRIGAESIDADRSQLVVDHSVAIGHLLSLRHRRRCVVHCSQQTPVSFFFSLQFFVCFVGFLKQHKYNLKYSESEVNVNVERSDEAVEPQAEEESSWEPSE